MLSVVLALTLVAIAVLSARWPHRALTVALVLLPLHTAAVLVGRNVVEVESAAVSLAGAWKEAVLIGLVGAAAWRLYGRKRSLHAAQLLALGVLALVITRIPLDVERGASLASAITGARSLAEPLALFLAVTILAPGYAWLRRTATWLIPVIVAIAYIGIVQPMVGEVLYDNLYHSSGGRLHHSYVAQLPTGPQLRAVGTFIAPNEFGLGLVILLSVFVAPMLATTGHWRIVGGAALIVGSAALLLSFSRSAWLGAGIGSLTLFAVHRTALRHWLAQRWRVPAQRRAIVTLSALVGATVVVAAAVTGAVGLVIDTLTGAEPSAAGRGASIATGVEAAIAYPGGIGLGTAGPRALAFEARPILTENWYLLWFIQLGWVPGILLLIFLGAVLVLLVRQAATEARVARDRRSAHGGELYPAAVAGGVLLAYVAALVGALFIPAFLDLPASLTLWAVVGIVVAARLRTEAAVGAVNESGHAEPSDGFRVAVAGLAAWSLIAFSLAPWRPAVTGIAVTAQKGDTGSPDGFPENTLEAFVRAAEKGADAVEIDVQRSADGTWYAILGPDLDRTTTGSGLVEHASDAEIDRVVIDGGIGYDPERHGGLLRIPRLSHVLQALRDYDVQIHLDLKETEPSAHEALAELIVEQRWAERTIINSKSVAAARAVKSVSPEIVTSAQREYVASAPSPLPVIDVWLAKHSELGAVPATRPAREVEVFVHLEALGVDETTVLARARRYGASSIMTNDLDAILEALQREPDR